MNHFRCIILGCTVEGRGQDLAEVMRRLGVPGADEMMMRGIRADQQAGRIGWRRLVILRKIS